MATENNFSPKEFLKNRRPERFSDSVEIEQGQLDRPILEHYLATLNIRSQELEFEVFVKKICEKIICPNLLEQTGPVAGGDGKTDTQTFPVSEQNKLLWFEGINESSHKERWAFAVSTQKTWKEKCGKDVEKIALTERGYERAYCITNQSIKSNQRSALEDDLTKKFNIKVTILDLSWILDQVFKNKLESVAIETLNISTNYKREIKIGNSDYTKQLELDRLSKIINEEVNPQEITFNQVDYFLEVARLSKELEKPILETQGLFLRAINISKKFGTLQQQLDAYYQFAWAAYWWFEDFSLFEENLKHVFELIKEDTSATKWEDLITLLMIYIGQSLKADIDTKIDGVSILAHTKESLIKISQDDSRPSNALRAKVSLCLLGLLSNVHHEENLSSIFKELITICKEGEGLIGFPFDSTYSLISELDSIFWKNKDYESLLDYLTEQVGIRNSQTQSSLLLLNRGIRRLDSDEPYQAIILLGKSLTGLYKEESIDEMVLACTAISSAFTKVCLNWASRASLLFAASILTDHYWKYNEILPSAIKIYWQLAFSELILGRIAQSLTWYKLALICARTLDKPYISEDDITNYFGCLSHLLTNCSLSDLKELEYLPDQLNDLGLIPAYEILLYLLGYEENLSSVELENPYQFLISVRDYDKLSNIQQYSPILGKRLSLKTIVMGCQVGINFPNRSPFIEMSESILSLIELFFATGVVDKIYFIKNSITIDIIADDDDSGFIEHNFSEDTNGLCSEITCSNFNWESLTKEKKLDLQQWFYKYILDILPRSCFIPDMKYLKKLIIEDKALSRAIPFSIVFNSTYNVLGRDAYQTTLNLLNGNQGKKYELLRHISWDSDAPKKEKLIKQEDSTIEKKDEKASINMEKIKHNEIHTTSLVNTSLWDKAEWCGVGFGTLDTEPPYLILIFTHGQQGLNVFLDLFNKVGKEDSQNKLRISVIRGISRKNPSHYRVIIGENLPGATSAKVFYQLSRIQTMEPNDNVNWSRFYKSFQVHKSFKLIFGTRNTIDPKCEERYIRKAEINVRNACDIGEHDIDAVAIIPDDDIMS